jgi:hypothetical protein
MVLLSRKAVFPKRKSAMESAKRHLHVGVEMLEQLVRQWRRNSLKAQSELWLRWLFPGSFIGAKRLDNIFDFPLEFPGLVLPPCEICRHTPADLATVTAFPPFREEITVQVQRDQRVHFLAPLPS